MRPKELVRHWVAAFNTADADAMAAFYAEDAINHQVVRDPIVGRAAIREMFAAEFAEGQSDLTGDLVIYYCEAETQALCLIERVRITAPLSIESGGTDTAVVSHTIELPEG